MADIKISQNIICVEKQRKYINNKNSAKNKNKKKYEWN